MVTLIVHNFFEVRSLNNGIFG